MATARDGNFYEEEALGTGGKFRKRPFRRSTQTTPYDRPPTALRNPSINRTDNSNGWFAKLVDPAQRLITTSAQRLFSSVFSKRLPPPPPPTPPLTPPEPERQQLQNSTDASREARDKHRQAVSTDPPEMQGVIIGGDIPNSSFERDGFTELEQVLKQKTFTRSEIDRVTALLRSRIVDLPVGDNEKSEGMLSKPVAAHIKKEEVPSTPVQDNGIESCLISSTHVVSSSVLDEDVASPAELAKAYMGSRSSKLSPSMLVSHSQAFREDPIMQSEQPFPSKSPITSLVLRSSSQIGVPNNGFMTPRSRGRSAIYSMARTPYSRIHPTTTLKGAAPILDEYGGPSSSSASQFSLEQNRQGGLKRRSSVLDSDIGSVGPMRRIRQKPNLLHSKNLSMPISGSTLSISGAGVSSNTAQFPSSLIRKPLLLDEPKNNSTKMSTENGDTSSTGTRFAHVPSKSSEMASKILQHLEVIISQKDRVNAREKFPSPLLPSMLRGIALRSMENADSRPPFGNVQNNKKLDDSLDISSPGAGHSTSQKQNKVEENGPTKYVAPNKSASAINGVENTLSIEDTVPSVKNADSSVMNTVEHSPVQKKRAFQMSAHEDYVDLDDDIFSNGAAPTPLTERRDKLDTSGMDCCKTIAAELITVEKTPAFSQVKYPVSPVLKQKMDLGTDLSVVAERSATFTFPTAPLPSMNVQPALASTQSTLTSDKAASPKKLDASPPILSSEEGVTSTKEPNAASPMFSFNSKSDDKVPQITFVSSSSVISESSGLKFGAFPASKPEISSSVAAFATGSTDSVKKVHEPDRPDNKNDLNAGVHSRMPENAVSSVISTSTASVFPFGTLVNSPSLNNGSLASSHSSFSSPISPLTSNNIFQNSADSSILSATTAFSTTNTTSTSSSAIPTAAVSSVPAASIFKFDSSAVAASVPATSVESVEAKINQDATFGNLISTPFGGTSAIANTGSSIFGFSAAATFSSTANNQSLGAFGVRNGSAETQASPAGSGTGVSTFSQSTPVQFGSSTSTPFELAGNASFSSGSSLFGSSTPANLFNSGTTYGMSSSATSSEANAISSSSGTTSSLFGSSWQPTKSPIFLSNNSTSTSTGFVVGASAASAAATNNAPMEFGSSNGASGPNFSFASAVTASSQSAISNPNPVFSFSPAPSSNNDQMSMVDSMAEDTIQASTPTVPIFGQQSIMPPPSAVMFSSTVPSGANPFQFGGQQNLVTPQNPSPFQASGSLDLGAGGSFSLGTSGGDKSNRRIVKPRKNMRKK